MPAFFRPFVVVLALLAIVASAPDASAGLRSREAFVSDTNHARLNHDRRVLQVCSDLTDVAQHWARWMARHHTLEHNPNIETEVHHWQSLGENIGVGGSERPIHRAFMHDVYHRDNILSPDYTQVGIGTARDDNGRLYVDEVFRRPS